MNIHLKQRKHTSTGKISLYLELYKGTPNKTHNIESPCNCIMAENSTKEQVNSFLNHMGLKIFLMNTAYKKLF